MQTLRKRSSPCKYKNEPSRFLGEGMTFKAKLIGILEVNEARGDKMCQDALNDLKTAIRAAGEHKQRITISIAIDGLRLRDEKSGDCLYHHPVHKISFIAQDMSDSRAFGYIFGSPDTGHRFFGIKTDKTASQVVISMRDLFQVVFELKKKEIEMAKHHIEQRQIKYGATSNADSIHPLKDDFESDRGKGKYQQMTKMRSVPSKTGESSGTATKGNTSEAIADLLDLEHELNSIQQGINQMDRITPSDPFGPLSKGDPFLDSFKDPFASKAGNVSEVKVSPPVSSKTFSAKPGGGSHGRSIDSPTEMKEQQNVFASAGSAAAKSSFFTQFSPSDTKPDTEEPHWFDQETESLFNDRTNISNTEPTSSSVAFPSEKSDAEQQQEEKKSPMKLDVFMELDPLGTGWVKPYIDKKDFFQDLKNPPKKVLKELIIGSSTSETPNYFPSQLESSKSPQNQNSTSAKEQSTMKNTFAGASSNVLNSLPSSKDLSGANKYSKIDPFEDTDPFDKTDPFSETNFPPSLGVPTPYNGKQFEAVFPEATGYEKTAKEPELSPPSKFSMFPANTIHGPLRVSLPPEKSDTNTPITLSSITSKFKSSPSPPEETKSLRRRNYQVLKQSVEDRTEDESKLPVQDEFFCSSRSPKKSSAYSPKTQRKTFKEKTFSVQTLPSAKHEKASKFWSDEFPDSDLNNPQNAKGALFSIKPPPVPPKKQNQPNFKPPARPPSLENNYSNYDYAKTQEEPDRFQESQSPKVDHQKAKTELRRPNSDHTNFPLLPPPPQRKSSMEKTPEGRTQREQKYKEIGGSILNITLNQLDNTGLQNLAETLGISSEHLYNMTLQELTKRLSEKCSKKTEINRNETFQADFESNFNNKEIGDGAPPYDKYAAFKELIENDNKNANYEPETHQVEEDQSGVDQKASDQQSSSRKNARQEDEDRYAALRQLSLNPQKSENLSEDLDFSVDDDSSTKADNVSDNIKTMTEDSITPKNDMEPLTDSSAIKAANDWSGEVLVTKEERGEDEEADQISIESTKTPSTEFADMIETQKTDFNEENNLFKDEDKTAKEEPEEARDNWATFDKVSAFEESILIKDTAEAFNDAENENSPFSSDGKEDSFSWHKKKSKQRGRKDKTWRDEDESWDDYSAKESYWSDESSHDDHTPDKRREGRYVRRGWNKQVRKSKVTNEQWFRRPKWNEDTEDEYEESWKNHRRRMGTCDIDRKNEMCPFNSYDNYEQSYKRCNSRSEPWEENDRYLRYFKERRKRSESDDEYRRRCDSDTSDREFVWTIKRNFPESCGRSERQKQYRMLPYMSRDYTERCHEPRSKHKRGESHKRPSSVSEGKRNYDKMYAGDHMNKTNRRMQDDDVSPSYHRDFRHCCGSESAHYYNSYDRRLQMVHGKKSNRNRRNDEQIQCVTGLESKEAKPESFDYYKSSWHKAREDSRRNGHFQFEDDFTPETPEKPLVQSKLQSPKRDPSESPKKKQKDEWTSPVKEEFLQVDNSSENFAKFSDEFKTTEISKSNEGKEREQTVKQQIMGQNHFAVLSRQESSASLRKSESINIFSRENDPFEGDDFFSSAPSSSHKLNKFTSEKSKSNSNVSDAFAWKEVFGDSSFHE